MAPNDKRSIEILKEHRGWKEFFINLVAAVASGFIGYGIAALALGRFSVFKPATDTGNKLDTLYQEIEHNIDCPKRSLA